jgi:purine-cytosine permease-like protein
MNSLEIAIIAFILGVLIGGTIMACIAVGKNKNEK